MFADFINSYGASILNVIVTAVFGFLGLEAKKLAKKYLDNKEKVSVAKTVVCAVEQLYHHLDGEEKLEKAMEAASEMLAARGITVTKLELRMLLEAAVGEFNDAFNSKIKEVA